MSYSSLHSPQYSIFMYSETIKYLSSSAPTVKLVFFITISQQYWSRIKCLSPIRTELPKVFSFYDVFISVVEVENTIWDY